MASQLSPTVGNDIESSFASVSSSALEASHVIRSTAGKVFKIAGRLDSTAPSATYYVQLFNAASLPADATVTTATFPAPIKIVHLSGTDDIFDFDFAPAGLWCSTGCVVVLSSTEFTKTISSAYLSITTLRPQN